MQRLPLGGLSRIDVFSKHFINDFKHTTTRTIEDIIKIEQPNAQLIHPDLYAIVLIIKNSVTYCVYGLTSG